MSSPPVSPTSDGSSSSHHRRRSSISFLTPPSPREKLTPSPTPMQFRCNFYVEKFEGLPSGTFNQYRMSVKVGDGNKCPKATATSWKSVKGKDEDLLVQETSPTFHTSLSSKITLQVMGRSRFKISSLVAESEQLMISDLWEQQNGQGLTEFFTIQLTNKENTKAVVISLNIRRLAERDHEGMELAQNLYNDYPGNISKAVKALEGLTHDHASTISIMHMPISMTLHIVHLTLEDLQKNERQKMPFKVEENIWNILSAIWNGVPRIKALENTDEAKFIEYLPPFLTVTLRGFRLLRQFHHTYGNQLDVQLQSLINEAKNLENNKGLSKASTSQFSVQYPEIAALKHPTLKFPETKRSNDVTLSENTTEFIKWMIDIGKPVKNVFWLHGKLDSGSARIQLSSTLVHGLQDIGLTFGYFSLAQRPFSSEPSRVGNKVEDLFDSLMDTFIYQLSLFDSSLADTFNETLKKTGINGTGDLYDRFQTFFQVLLSLDYQEYQPIVLIIDELDFEGFGSPTDFDALLDIFATASASAHTSPSPSATSTIINPTSPTTASSSSSSNIQVPGSGLKDSLPFPSFLRIIVLSRSLGSNPSLIEQFALIRDVHHLFKSGNDNATRGKWKGKGKAKSTSVDKIPLIPIAEADSQMGEAVKV